MPRGAMGITSDRLQELGLIDRIVNEPLGGAHRDPDAMAESLQAVLVEELEALAGMEVEDSQAPALPAPHELRAIQGSGAGDRNEAALIRRSLPGTLPHLFS